MFFPISQCAQTKQHLQLGITFYAIYCMLIDIDNTFLSNKRIVKFNGLLLTLRF